MFLLKKLKIFIYKNEENLKIFKNEKNIYYFFISNRYFINSK